MNFMHTLCKDVCEMLPIRFHISRPTLVKFGIDHVMPFSKCEFHHYWCGENHTSLKDVNESVPYFLHFSSFFEKNSVRGCPQKYIKLPSFVKISAG